MKKIPIRTYNDTEKLGTISLYHYLKEDPNVFMLKTQLG
jgi:hypothetical protein